MIRLRQVKMSIDSSINELLKKCSKVLNIKTSDIKDFKINKRSIDARHKPYLYYIYEIDLKVNGEDKILINSKNNNIMKTPNENYKFKPTGKIKLNDNIVIVGSGPAGLFCTYMLALNGYKPILIERGECVEDRINTVNKFWNTGILNPESNVQFGEGGAGTFSDGKLNTQIKDSFYRNKFVLKTFVECGAPDEILYEAKPHIGTDILTDVVIKLRNKIKKFGGKIFYNTTLTNIKIEKNKITAIEINHKDFISCKALVLALGHSSRDTFLMLHKNGLVIESKPFAVGVRIQHPQEIIDKNQYGSNKLGAASYKLTYKASNGHGVYSFCMCPGGYVVNASSEENRLTINGMSNHARDSLNANSAIIVTVNKNDFGYSPLSGLDFQRDLEKRAYYYGSGSIPIQLYSDFKNKKISTKFGSVEPIVKGKTKFADINKILPNFICDSLKEGIDYFGKKIKGFDMDDALISAVESRTSSPIRIIRNENFESNVVGIYPIGEGAGYAGGIMSAAIDGIKAFEKIAQKYKN